MSIIKKFRLFFIILVFMCTAIFIVWKSALSFYNVADLKMNDAIYKYYLEYSLPIKKNEQILYVMIDNNSYQNYFNSNTLDRIKLANLLEELSKYSPASLVLDIIFMYKSNETADSSLASVIKTSGNVYLPLAFNLSNEISGVMKIEEFLEHSFIKNDSFSSIENNIVYSKPPFFYSIPEISKNASAHGHIIYTDDLDGSIRKYYPFVKFNNYLIPSLSLKVFMDYWEVTSEDIEIVNSELLRINKSDHNWLNNNVDIYIDPTGQSIIPFFADWGNDFSMISLWDLVKILNKNDTKTLNELLNGKFIFIGDLSFASFDIKNISIAEKVPLIMAHTSILNSLINNFGLSQLSNFYSFLYLILISLVIITMNYFCKIRTSKIIGLCLIWAVIIFSSFLSLIIFQKFIPTASFVINTSIVFFISLFIKEVEMFTKKKIENDLLTEELNYAGKLQRNLFPKHGEEKILNKFEVWSNCKSTNHVSGDFYDIIEKENSLILTIGDVTGHGMSAAISGIFSSGVINHELVNNNSIKPDSINKINNTIYYKKTTKKQFVASAFLFIDFKNYLLSYINCGLPDIIHCNNTKVTVLQPELPRLPLGCFPNIEYHSSQFRITPGDLILFFSDGITEAVNNNNEQFGEERVINSLIINSSKSVKEIGQGLLMDIQKFSEGSYQEDDQTIIAFRLLG